MFSFEIIKKSKKSRARVGKITTPHGEIMTPAFIPVATLGAIKGGLDFEDVKKTEVQCAIMNTFHFWDMDRVDTVKKAGGLHNFTNFQKPIFTDSGGFQVFSLGKGAEFGLGKIGSIFPQEHGSAQNKPLDAARGKRRSTQNSFNSSLLFSNSHELENKPQKIRNGLVKKISSEGVKFLSPRDGRLLTLTPEKSAEIQIKLGADFIYLLDICGSITDDKKTTAQELQKTLSWYKRFLAEVSRQGLRMKDQRLFAIIQGGLFKDLRLVATQTVNELPTFGIAIGGAFGKTRQDMFKMLGWINEKIDWSRPHHLLGIGDLESIPKIIDLGVDLFDCALPTRIARHGTALTSKGYLNISKGILKNKFQPIEKTCQCFTCQNYSLAQLNFLVKAKEMLAGKLLTIHNLFYIENWLEKIREKI